MMRWELTALAAFSLLAPNMALAGPTASRGALAAVLGNLDRQFTCPEFLADNAARDAERESFGRSLSGLKISYAQASYIRAKMLDRHHCSNGAGLPAASVPAEPVKEASVMVAGTAAGLQH